MKTIFLIICCAIITSCTNSPGVIGVQDQPYRGDTKEMIEQMKNSIDDENNSKKEYDNEKSKA